MVSTPAALSIKQWLELVSRKEAQNAPMEDEDMAGVEPALEKRKVSEKMVKPFFYCLALHVTHILSCCWSREKCMGGQSRMDTVAEMYYLDGLVVGSQECPEGNIVVRILGKYIRWPFLATWTGPGWTVIRSYHY